MFDFPSPRPVRLCFVVRIATNRASWSVPDLRYSQFSDSCRTLLAISHEGLCIGRRRRRLESKRNFKERLQCSAQPRARKQP